MKLRDCLKWLGIESEHGVLSHDAVLLVASLVLFMAHPGVWAFSFAALAFLAQAVERRASHERTKLAMDCAHLAGVVRQTEQTKIELAMIEQETRKIEAVAQEDVDKLQKEFADLQEKLSLLAKPEQIAKLQEFFKSRLGVGAGRM